MSMQQQPQGAHRHQEMKAVPASQNELQWRPQETAAVQAASSMRNQLQVQTQVERLLKCSMQIQRDPQAGGAETALQAEQAGPMVH